MDNMNLNSFLKLGYFLDYKNPSYSFSFQNVNKKKYETYTEEQLIQVGVEKLKGAITKEFDLNKKHVVPISGGLDSRAILAGLLECTEAKNIYTYTFGVPGTLDYDIGCYVAKQLGTRHTPLSLAEYKYNMDELIDISRRVDHQTVLFHHAPIWVVDNHFKGCKVWSGFLGEILTGDHLSKNMISSETEAKKHFIENNTYVSSINLLNCSNEDLYTSVENPGYNTKNIALEEQLDFYNRQLKYIAPHVLLKGFSYKTPFLNQEWVDFILSIDNKYRFNQHLYKKILLGAFPEAFSYGIKTNHGLRINANKGLVFLKKVSGKVKRIINSGNPLFTSSGTNYIDFDKGIRNRNDLNRIIYESIMDLKKRKIIEWIDIDSIWNDYINGYKNYGDALMVLSSLEIHFKSMSQGKRPVFKDS